MIYEKDYVKEISRRSGEKKSIVLLILKEYARICINLLINGNVVELPKDFGTLEIVRKPWTQKSLEHYQKKSKHVDITHRNRTNFTVNYNEKYQMKIYGVGQLVVSLKYVSDNNLKRFRYVDK